MPATFDNAYAQWLTQHGEVRSQGVTVLEFSHPKFGSKFVSDYGEPFAARTELGVQFIAEPLGFIIDRAAENFSTEQRVTIRLDNANGRVTSELRSLNEDDLQTPVAATVRGYLDTRRTAPAFDPIMLFVTNTKATRLAVECEASADQLPNVTAGIRYTFDLFPPLVFL
jgi:Domain of unknown function (DUF1833)